MSSFSSSGVVIDLIEDYLFRILTRNTSLVEKMWQDFGFDDELSFQAMSPTLFRDTLQHADVIVNFLVATRSDFRERKFYSRCGWNFILQGYLHCETSFDSENAFDYPFLRCETSFSSENAFGYPFLRCSKIMNEYSGICIRLLETVRRRHQFLPSYDFIGLDDSRDGSQGYRKIGVMGFGADTGCVVHISGYPDCLKSFFVQGSDAVGLRPSFVLDSANTTLAINFRRLSFEVTRVGTYA